MPDKNDLREEGLILAHRFSGFTSWLSDPMHLGKRSQQWKNSKDLPH